MAADSKFERIEQERQVREGFWPKIATFAANLPFAEQALAAWYCAFDKETPSTVRYTLPLIGFADDASVLSAALLAVGTHMTEAHKAAARADLERFGRKA
jgi:uncharacterized membrane protein YkvA (DUF1232 family)